MAEEKHTKKEIEYHKRMNDLLRGKILITDPAPQDNKKKKTEKEKKK